MRAAALKLRSFRVTGQSGATCAPLHVFGLRSLCAICVLPARLPRRTRASRSAGLPCWDCHERPSGLLSRSMIVRDHRKLFWRNRRVRGDGLGTSALGCAYRM
ncbi:hypothetical protein CC86DRAFT_101599 [Ophiobolus disseminans]|uniref:Uncharacterized protein n=1 Tax=Ophiobolus disseminans TaxID=1469910 RepID=A0A6A6ZLB3_9PLEO|nr:hypothetical protein CC86DRAFT_101599 [Ophiobolus disseminans]